MEKKTYLVQIDTTESTMRVGLPAGLLNTFVVRATDPLIAKQMVLRIHRPNIIEQIRNSLYVYEINSMEKNLDILEERGDLPIFSFIPLNGGRPPRQTDVQLVNLGNNSISPVNTPEQRSQVERLDESVQVQPQQLAANNPRSAEFRRTEQSRPLVQDVLNEEQADIVRRLGAIPLTNDNNTPRVNASTGINVVPTKPQDNSNSLSKEQAEILAKIGVINEPTPDFDPELRKEIIESKGFIDDMSVVDEKPLDEAELKRLQSELQE